MRVIVDLPKEQIAALKKLEAQTRLSGEELMRRAVSEFLVRHQLDEHDSAFGLWAKREKGQAEDGLVYQQRLRTQWPE